MTSKEFSLRGKTQILFVISRFLDGGIDTVLVELLKNLVRNSSTLHGTLVIANKMAGKEVFINQIPADVDVRYLVDEPWLQRYKCWRLDGHHSHLLSFLDEVFLNPIRRILQRKRFRRLQRKADVVIDMDSRAMSIIDWSQLTLNIAYYHFSFQHMMDSHPHYIRRVARALARYDYVVAISKEMAEEGIRLFPWLREKLVTIYNGVRRDHLLRLAAEEVTHPMWFRLSRQSYMLAVERLEESQKDLTTLIEAYALLSQRMQNIPHLVVLGEGNDRELLQKLINQHGLQEHIHLLGFTQNPYPWMKNAQLLVHSSKFEGLPTVLIEALMLGKQIVASDCPTGPREILADGKAGMLVPVGDVRALADAMHAVLTDVALQERLRVGVRAQTVLFRPRENIVKLLGLLDEEA
ncbi:MAG: glycosyltransferase [Bacteroidaceae bacterium]|nr:glycosyltransferase [Bacteroidaceae bacterium]